jgi:hypothetical protein
MQQIIINGQQYDLNPGTIRIGDTPGCLIKIKTPYNMHHINACCIVTSDVESILRLTSPDVRIREWNNNAKIWESVVSMQPTDIMTYALKSGHKYQLQFFPDYSSGFESAIEIDVVEVPSPASATPRFIEYFWPGAVMLIPMLVSIFSPLAGLWMMGVCGVVLSFLAMWGLRSAKTPAGGRLQIMRMIIGLILVFACAALLIFESGCSRGKSTVKQGSKYEQTHQ